MLPTPGFHHLHLNSADPDAAIDWYVRQFPSTKRIDWHGIPALQSPNNVKLLFHKVTPPPVSEPQSAIWHFGWHVTDSRARVEEFKRRSDVPVLPLYTTDAGGSVPISSDTWPGTGGVPGRTKAQIAQAQREGIEPSRSGGFAYMTGPDNALVEIAGNYPAERFNHVHLYQEDPLGALLWYHRHLNAPLRGGVDAASLTGTRSKVVRGEERSWPALNQEGMFRAPRAGTEFGDVAMLWYPNQGEQPLVRSSGQLQDHIGLSVNDLDAWCEKLSREGVELLGSPYPLGDTRAVMLLGPSEEVLELVETL